MDAVPISNRHWHVPGEQLLSLRGTSLWFENFGMCLLCQNSAPTMNIGTFSYSCLFHHVLRIKLNCLRCLSGIENVLSGRVAGGFPNGRC